MIKKAAAMMRIMTIGTPTARKIMVIKLFPPVEPRNNVAYSK